MKNNPYIKIKNLKIGYDYPPVVISELGINHNGNLKKAIYLVDEAIKSGAQIIKHQTHIPEEEMSIEAKKIIPDHINTSIFNIIKKCSLSEKDEFALKKYVESKKKIFISTPFSFAAVDRLKKFNVPAIKIGSGECNNYPLIEYICKLKKPIILSTGMNSISSIRPSVKIIEKNKIPYALLHCTNIYPTPPSLVRLGGIQQLREAFPDAVIGLSDHTVNNFACLGAVALGASILERHFTDDMNRPGPDISCSMDPSSLKELINGSKIIFLERGGEKKPIEQESQTMAFAFASVIAVKDINPGEILTEDNLWVRRPGGGDFTSIDYDSLLGKKVKKFVKKNERLKKIDFE